MKAERPASGRFREAVTVLADPPKKPYLVAGSAEEESLARLGLFIA
jgi:hypothetical protein